MLAREILYSPLTQTLYLLFCRYKGKNLTSAHAHFKVTDGMYNEFKSCMEAAMKDLNVHSFVAKDVLIVVEHFKKEIVRS